MPIYTKIFPLFPSTFQNKSLSNMTDHIICICSVQLAQMQNLFPLLNGCLVAHVQLHALKLFDSAVRGALSSPSYFTGLSYSNIRLANDKFCIDGFILGGLHHQNNISIKSKLKNLIILRSIWNKLKCIWFFFLVFDGAAPYKIRLDRYSLIIIPWN